MKTTQDYVNLSLKIGGAIFLLWFAWKLGKFYYIPSTTIHAIGVALFLVVVMIVRKFSMVWMPICVGCLLIGMYGGNRAMKKRNRNVGMVQKQVKEGKIKTIEKLRQRLGLEASDDLFTTVNASKLHCQWPIFLNFYAVYDAKNKKKKKWYVKYGGDVSAEEKDNEDKEEEENQNNMDPSRKKHQHW